MPTVSITIPARNEEKFIQKCLQSIVDSDFEKDSLQVFVCDGMSTDNTRVLIKEFEQKYAYINLIENMEQSTPHALNLGLQAAEADYKIILGAHAEIAPDFITKNLRVLEKHPEVGCSGGVLQNVYENEVSAAIGAAMSSPFGVGNSYFRTGAKSGYVDTVAFGCYRKEVFDKIGYFDEELVRNQDDEFNYRLLKNGYKIWLDSNIQAVYYVRADFPNLFRQFYQYGYWKVFVNKKYRALTTFRQFIPFMFVGFLAFVVVFPFMGAVLQIAYLVVFLLYLALAVFFAKRKSKGSSMFFKILKSFLVLHISYGLGYWKAVWHFLILNRKADTKSKRLSR